MTRPSAPRRPSCLVPIVLASGLVAGSALAQGPGFPNVPQTPGTLLAGLVAPEQGRTAILAYHNGILFSVPEIPSSQPGADFQVRTWDISDPTDPVELAQWGTTPMPINAHGYLQEGDFLVLGPNWPEDTPWSFVPNGSGVARAASEAADCIGVRGCLFQPWIVQGTFWSYSEVSGTATLSKDEGWPWTVYADWDHLGLTGVIGHPFLLGDLLIFASDQSRTGVATYDVSDPTHPVLLDVLTTGGPGGYWPELWAGNGRLYVVFPYRVGGNGIRVVDLTDPTDLQLVADRSLPGAEAMYVQFQDEYAFVGDHKVDMRTFESVLHFDGANTVRTNDGGIGVDTSQFALPLGNLVVTGGVGPNEGMAIWAHQAEPDTRGPEVAYHIPQAGRTGYSTEMPISLLIHETLDSTTLINGTTFVVREFPGGAALPGRLVFAFDDILTFTPDAPLAEDTTYEVVLPAGGIRDAVGNATTGYSFTFSTGSTVGGNAPPSVTSVTATPRPAEPGESVDLSAAASDADLDPLEYRFDFGDGSPPTAWSSTASTSTSWAEPGHYRATVQVGDPSGAIGSATTTVTILVPPSGPQPTHSSSIVCDDAGRTVFVADPDNDRVAAIHADALTRDAEIPVCDDPRSVARVGSQLWVTCFDADAIAVLDATTGASIDELDTEYGSGPHGVVGSPDGSTVFASFPSAGEIRRFDATTRAETGRLELGSSPRALAVNGAGTRLYVTRFLSAADWAEVWEVDTATFAVLRTLRIDKLGGDAYRDTTASGKGTPNQLTAIVIEPGDAHAWVTATLPNRERGLLTGPDLDADNTVRNLLLRLDLATGDLERTVDLDNSESASALAISPLGDYLFATIQGNDLVQVNDLLELGDTAGLGTLVTRLGTGGAPQGVCVDPTTGRTFTQNLTDRSATVLETSALFLSGSVSVASSEVATGLTEALPADVLAGKRIFYFGGDPRMSSEGYLSCATCHLDGGHDGRTWDFTGRGEGLRNTTDLRGRSGTGHGNVHWTANFDEIQDFEGDIRNAFGGSGFLEDSDWAATSAPLGAAKAGLSPELDALAAFVDSLGASSVPRSPERAPDGSMTALGLTGRAVFGELGCGSCHAGSEMTDSQVGDGLSALHDVGTLRSTSGQRLGGPLPGIDTPSLRGAWDGSPYLHDGTAATLDDVFRASGGVVLPAESGALGGDAFSPENWVDLNYDGTVRGEALVHFPTTGDSVTFSGVDGGSGGDGAVVLRTSNGPTEEVEVVVNGAVHVVSLVPSWNEPSWRQVNWVETRLEGIALLPGAANTLEIRTPETWPNVALDEIVVSTADDLAAAAPHRVALGLPTGDFDALVSYVRQLDGTPEINPADGLFADGFESGDTSRW